MNTANASVQLACALPPSQGYKGACSNLADIAHAYRHGSLGTLWSKREAAILWMAMNMQAAEHYGHGNKAAKRAAKLELAREQAEANAWFDSMRITDQDIDALHSLFGEARVRTPGMSRRDCRSLTTGHVHEMPIAQTTADF